MVDAKKKTPKIRKISKIKKIKQSLRRRDFIAVVCVCDRERKGGSCSVCRWQREHEAGVSIYLSVPPFQTKKTKKITHCDPILKNGWLPETQKKQTRALIEP